MRQIQPAGPVLSTTLSSGTASSSPFFLGNIFSVQVGYLVVIGAGLTATFQLMVSQDGTTYYDCGQILPSVSGSATNFVAEYDGSFPYVKLQATWGSGSGTVVVRASAKGGA